MNPDMIVSRKRVTDEEFNTHVNEAMTEIIALMKSSKTVPDNAHAIAMMQISVSMLSLCETDVDILRTFITCMENRNNSKVSDNPEVN